MRKIENIIIHHSLSLWGNAEVIRRWHCDPKPIGNGWKFPGYHIVIGNGLPDYYSYRQGNYRAKHNGMIERMLPDTKISNGCRGANSRSLNICLIGNFDYTAPSLSQLESLIKVVGCWLNAYKLSKDDIYGHGEMMGKLDNKYIKSCPGELFDMCKFRKMGGNLEWGK